MSKTLKKAEVDKKKTKGKVHLFVLMDESGSMAGKEEAVVSGCNEFIGAFKKNKKARGWLAFFDSNSWTRDDNEEILRLKLAGEKISKSTKLSMDDYRPRGGTPLNDAIIQSIERLNAKVKDDETVFMSIITDGHENASRATQEDVKALIEQYEDKGWSFVYLGANQNAQRIAAGYGLGKGGQSFNFTATKAGVAATMDLVAFAAAAHSAAYDQFGAGQETASASLAARSAMPSTIEENYEDDA